MIVFYIPIKENESVDYLVDMRVLLQCDVIVLGNPPGRIESMLFKDVLGM